MGYRTLTCAPTNVAIKGVSSCVLELVKESIATDSGTDGLFCSVGDILLFGSKASLKLGSDIEEIYLDYRVQRLTEFLGPVTGWRHCFASMIDLLEDCVSQYHIFLENESIKEKEQSNEKEIEEGESSDKTDGSKRKYESFLDFLRERFVSTSTPLKNCFRVFCTHLPKKYILENNYQNMVSRIGGLLESFGKLLFQHNVESVALEKLFSDSELHEDIENPFVDISFLLHARRKECLLVLKNLRSSFNELDLPSSTDKRSIVEFCFRAASLLFCTASSSYKLRSVAMEPLNVLVVDEAAQLKECESTIPLQLPGLRHAILVGDECQLPAMVESNISAEAGFGRSLFERLILLGKMKHLLNVQYRMHPSISSFPNSNFYFNQILDASKVKRKSYEKQYLPWPMFGAYSFINIVGGREEKDDVGHGWRNLVEVAVVMKLLRKLYKGWVGSRQKLSVGVISPYAAQVAAIQDKLGRYYNIEGFAVKLKSVDGFQGGEEDIIILSTVRCNRYSSVGFMSKPQRTNVALTRARHCLWIVGNESTLANSDSVWEALVLDAKNRQCFFNADEDKDLHKAIFYVKKALDQFDDLLNSDSILFRNARWKVLFSDNFLKSFRKLKCVQQKKSVINHLLMLSNGWRPKKRSLDPVCESSSQMLKQFKIGDLYIICANDIVKEWSEEVGELRYIQVFKIWDILPAVDIPKLVKRLDSLFRNYTDDFLHRCKEKCLQGSLEVPKSWSITSDIVRIKNAATEGSNYVENAVGSESLMLMKFYSLSSGVVGQLLSTNEDGELDLPFEVNDEEREVILFPRSAFIIGRSGTGKTTVLTMKLLEKEKLFHMAADSFGYKVTGNRTMHNQEIEEAMPEARGTILRQLFVTVSHKLCYVVKQHVSNLKSAACGGNSSKGSSSFDTDEFDDAAQFKDIPDSFVDVPPNLYPLVVTFQKFLLMLDGTLGNSYFERFHELWKLSHGRVSGRSVALQSFIRMKEVHYERFSSSYWPRFNTKLTKNLDSSRVFTQIISHIKGGAQASDGKLSRDEYIQLSESSVSSLSRQEREVIYDIFQKYEKMKMENGEFDLADLVIDLHRRLRVERYAGDIMDFIYVDEVQDLTLSQIALFKYICKNVEEGFVFSGDTAQTISRGIDFRFQDIRSLFYNKFLLESKGSGHDKRGRKGIISDIFHLRQNFRTHDGVLKLAQSIIELIYHFFPQSIDVLEPETSLVNGEAPIFLQSGDNGNAIVTIFGSTGNTGASIVGFGAEQKKCLVQDRKLDGSLVQAMQVASSSEEWRSQGIKMRHSNPEAANVILREAADIFEAIGKADYAALCFIDMEEYERAGRLYLEKCGESELEKAGECFFLAGCYELAADVYARGIFSRNVCKFAPRENYLTKRKEIEKIEQEFIESGARHIYELKDPRSMMKFVKAFQSIELMRKFLKPLGCLEELLLLEEESGNFLEAANIAKLRGEILRTADLQGKAGNFQEASRLILFFVLSNSLWAPGSEGWPLKQFTQKQELLEKAKSFAKNVSDTFFAFVCTEADVLSHEQSNLSVMKNYLNASQRHKSVGGEIISARKIIDAHLCSSCSKYVWEDQIVSDLMLTNTSYGDFCLNYFGVWKQFHDIIAVYVLLNSDADWVRELDNEFLHRSGNLVSIDVRHFVSTVRSYWCSELLFVGLKVLENLEALYNFTSDNSLSMFSGSRCLTLIFEVANFLLESKYLNCSHYNVKALQRFVKFSTESYFGLIFPLDWRKSLSDNMLSLRETEVSNHLLQQVIVENISLKGKLTCGRIGRVVMVILGAVKLKNYLCEEILKRFDGDDRNPLWKTLIQILCGQLRSKFPHGTVPEKLHEALLDTCWVNWRKEIDYISPGCFLYLVERLLILASCFQGFFITSKSSFAEWFNYLRAGRTSTESCFQRQSKPRHKVLLMGVLPILVLKCFLLDRECSELAPENSTNISGEEVPMNYSYFWGIFEALKSPDNGSDPKSLVSNPQAMKVDVEKSIHLVSTVMTDCRENHIDHNDENLFEEVASMLDELKQLSAALNLSEPEPGLYMPTMGELSRGCSQEGKMLNLS
ncbi:putative helicase MAGATAMA 3 [Morella rubra]|uniref:Putative helicase MAGATAMA 3 n=1 Tax=Morella rubra TaxID=262757 RepID=A0A6A1UXQ7_9ROSI|nr:putative helicase MAGATAMA 3 [Morella rubra]